MPFTRLTQVNTGESAPLDLDATTGGNVLMRAGGGSNSWVSTLAADGTRTTLVANYTDSALAYGTIHALTGGGFVIDGIIYSGGGRGTNLRTFDAQGNATSALLAPSAELDGNTLASAGHVITRTANGGFALVWNEDTHASTQLPISFTDGGTYNFSEGMDVRIGYYGSTGGLSSPSVLSSAAPVTTAGTTTSRLTANQYVYDAATLTGGGIAYVQTDERTVGGGQTGLFAIERELTLFVSGAPGNPGTPVKVDLGTYLETSSQQPQALFGDNNANVVALANGGIAVIWTEYNYVRTGPTSFVQDGWTTKLRYFDASGQPTSTVFDILHRDAAMGNITKYVFAEALPDGRIAVAWHEGIYGVNGNGQVDAYAGIIGASGIISDITRVNATAATNTILYYIQDIAVDSNGVVDIAFRNEGGSNSAATFNGLTQIARFQTDAATPGVTYNAPGGGATYAGTAGDDLITGGVGNDVLLGQAGNDRIDGGAGNDVIAGGAGDDVISGGTGGNELYGGAGNDQFVVTTGGDTIVELAGGGIDTVQTTLASYTLAAEVENLTFGDNLAHIGFGNTADNVLTGGTGFDQLAGGAGNDTLVGGNGAANQLVGGTGNDIYVATVAGDTIVENANEGTDTVQTTVTNFVLSANLENLTFTDGDAHSGVGNASANILTSGTGLANTLVGGLGDDVYVVRAGGTSVVEAAGEGTDTVQTTLAGYTLETNVENLTFVGTGAFGGVGNGADNVITGGAGADTLVGLGGNDTLIGGGGLDYLLGGAGADRFVVQNLTSGPDRILDFTSGQDSIVLDPSIAHTGTLSLVSGTGGLAATTANSTFLYNTASGELFYDADGTGTGAAVLIELLNPGLTLATGDFLFA